MLPSRSSPSATRSRDFGAWRLRMLAQGIDKVATLPIPPEIDKLATLSIPGEIDKVATSSMPKDATD